MIIIIYFAFIYYSSFSPSLLKNLSNTKNLILSGGYCVLLVIYMPGDSVIFLSGCSLSQMTCCQHILPSQVGGSRSKYIDDFSETSTLNKVYRGYRGQWTSCPGRLWSLHLWRYTNPNSARPWATCSWWPCFEQEAPSNLNHFMTQQRCGGFHSSEVNRMTWEINVSILIAAHCAE